MFTGSPVGEPHRIGLDINPNVDVDGRSWDPAVDSSLAYQWGARGLAKRDVMLAQELATGGLEPDLKILLDLPVDTALQRRMATTHEINRLDREQVEFRTRVRDAYHSLVAENPARWRVVNAEQSENDVWDDVRRAVAAEGLFAAESRSIAR